MCHEASMDVPLSGAKKTQGTTSKPKLMKMYLKLLSKWNVNGYVVFVFIIVLFRLHQRHPYKTVSPFKTVY